MVLDASSSMDAVRKETISAYNEFLNAQRRTRVDELFVTFLTFQSDVSLVYRALPIADAPVLRPQQFTPGGMTALYDGIETAIRAADEDIRSTDRVLVVVLTDGEENASRRTKKSSLRALMDARRARGNWTFVLLGASGYDADTLASDLGVPTGNTTNYADVGAALSRTGVNVTDYRGRDDLKTDQFFHPVKRWARPSWAKPSVVVTDAD